MRKITEQACEAFLAGKNWRSGNMRVERGEFWAHMYLHDNLIASRRLSTGKVIGTLAGWPTPTTRERLNGLARSIDGVGVYQRNHEQFTDLGPLGNDDWYQIGWSA